MNSAQVTRVFMHRRETAASCPLGASCAAGGSHGGAGQAWEECGDGPALVACGEKGNEDGSSAFPLCVRVVKAKPFCFISWVKERGERGNKKTHETKPDQNPDQTQIKRKGDTRSKSPPKHQANLAGIPRNVLLGGRRRVQLRCPAAAAGSAALPRPSPRVGRNFINFGY